MNTSVSEHDASRNPPIDSEILIHSYLVKYGTGNIGSASTDPFQVIVYIRDARQYPDGSHYRNELYVLKDSLYASLPAAFQFQNGVIRFFVYESQLVPILVLLQHSPVLWLKTKGGRVSIITGEELVK